LVQTIVLPGPWLLWVQPFGLPHLLFPLVLIIILFGPLVQLFFLSNDLLFPLVQIIVFLGPWLFLVQISFPLDDLLFSLIQIIVLLGPKIFYCFL